MSIYRIAAVQPSLYTYVDLANLNRTLQISSKRSKVSNRQTGVDWTLNRTSIVLTTPERVSQEGCESTCGPSTEATRLVRFETSANVSSKQQLLDDIAELFTIVDNSDPTFWEGLMPSQNVDINTTV